MLVEAYLPGPVLSGDFLHSIDFREVRAGCDGWHQLLTYPVKNGENQGYIFWKLSFFILY